MTCRKKELLAPNGNFSGAANEPITDQYGVEEAHVYLNGNVIVILNHRRPMIYSRSVKEVLLLPIRSGIGGVAQTLTPPKAF